LLEKQRPDGRWNLEQGYRTDRPLVANLLRDVEEVGRPSKWVTLTALVILKRCAGLVERLKTGEAIAYEPPRPPDGFPAYPWAYSRRDEARVRAQWGELEGMADVLDRLVAFARRHRIRTGWYQGFVMGPDNCPEWLSSMTKLVPAKTMGAAFPVARTMFLAPRGQFAAEGLVERLSSSPWHDYPTPVRPGSWVQKALWRARVDRWSKTWDTVGVAIRHASELAAVSKVMAEALQGTRRVLR
jgi:hypothetical protein